MADQTLLTKARKARFDDLPNFSGHPSEDVERFLKCIKNITKANDESSNHEILEIVRGKLTQAAGLWFDNNEHTFKKWSDFEIQFRNRYASTTIIHQKFNKLKQRTQLPDESVSGYIDDVINLCREIDSSMSDSIIIQHLMSGINPEFRKEISRHESGMNSLNEFLKYAKIEQDLYDTFEKTRQLSFESQPPTFTINQAPRPRFTQNFKQSDAYQPPSFNSSFNRSFHSSSIPSFIPSTYPVYIKLNINDQPVETIIDTGSAISIIHSTFLKTIPHQSFKYQVQQFRTANSTPLNIIGGIKLKINTKSITTYINAYVATNLITSMLLGNDWINTNHVHLFGDKNDLTIPDQHDNRITIPYVEPSSTNYSALLVNQVSLPPNSQTLVDITCRIHNANNLMFEPKLNHASKFIFIPNSLINIQNSKAKILLINTNNHPQILSKNTPIDYSNPPNSNITCQQCNEHFLSGNDLQKHLRTQCYSDQIRNQIIESTKHLENEKQRLAIQDILWRNKILFDPTPSIINISLQSAIKTGNHPPIYSKQYSCSSTDQDLKHQETQKIT
ncbi:unnamed protein product [Rotaria magnacalcarata]|uniref:Retrotransposon gag domain-containing protein n=1 Tax=Rotaria magnacalcarata TaxID=392030 RepID=A0A816YYM3_9BILA|nr:unnamed protein product [Rotaria magnacalcarata]